MRSLIPFVFVVLLATFSAPVLADDEAPLGAPAAWCTADEVCDAGVSARVFTHRAWSIEVFAGQESGGAALGYAVSSTPRIVVGPAAVVGWDSAGASPALLVVVSW